MPENETGSEVTEAAKVVAEITKNVPIYQDALQPAAKQLGKSLETVAKAVNTALLPVEGLIWGVDKIKDFVRDKVAAKLENVPPEDIQQPKPHIGVPAIDALRYMGSEPELSELYANLLAMSMDKTTAYQAHPAFVDIIKNMCPDEARLMNFFATRMSYPIVDIRLVDHKDQSFTTPIRHISLLGLDAKCEHPPLASNYVDNLERLGLVQIPPMKHLSDNAFYKRIEDHPEIKKIIEDLKKAEGKSVEVEKMKIEVTDLGKQFIRACVIDKRVQQKG